MITSEDIVQKILNNFNLHVVVLPMTQYYEMVIIISGFLKGQDPKTVLQEVRELLNQWDEKPAIYNFFVVTDLP